MRSYFDEMRAALERHGGTVEKFIGDAVVGVFGVPEAHEDDALRACRAALEMQERASRDARTRRRSIACGSASTPARSSPGRGAAARCSPRETRSCWATRSTSPPGSSRRPAPGEVLIGEATYRLVRDAVRVEPVEPIEAKGKSEPLAAYRLLEVSAPGRCRGGPATPLVGRDGGARAARARVRRASAERRCRLVTVVGEPGVGKSRLAAELVARIGAGARVVARRLPLLRRGDHLLGDRRRSCASWPGSATSDSRRRQARASASSRQRIAQLARALGRGSDDRRADRAGDRGVPRGGRARAAARRASSTTSTGPSRRCSTCSRGCPALIDGAPVLAALPRAAGAARDAARLAGHGPARAARRGRGRRAAREPRRARRRCACGSPRRRPATRSSPRSSSRGCARAATLATTCRRRLNALLGARLDRLEPAERDALERGAVEGELFHRGAVVELSDRRRAPSVPGELEAARPQGPDPAWPRRASPASDRLPLQAHPRPRRRLPRDRRRSSAPTLHERFADWLERRRRRPRRRVPRDPRLPPRAGLPLPRRARRRSTTTTARSASARPATSAPPAGAPTTAATSAPRRTCSARATALLPADSSSGSSCCGRARLRARPDRARCCEARAIAEELYERATALGERGLAAHARVVRARRTGSSTATPTSIAASAASRGGDRDVRRSSATRPASRAPTSASASRPRRQGQRAEAAALARAALVHASARGRRVDAPGGHRLARA